MKKVYLSLLLFSVVNFLNAQDAFWSEDFSTGLSSGWNAIEVEGNGSASSNWTYTSTGPSGSFAPDPIASTTAGNGWFVFDSDLNCTQTNQEAWLVSPRIDASGRANVFLAFETYYRSFDDRPTIEVSVDSMTWVSYEVFPGITANEFGGDGENPQNISIDISDVAAGESTFWIAFRFLSSADTPNGGSGFGCAYAWQVDDVSLSDTDPRPANDMRISTNFFAIAPNAVTPASQVIPFGFLADIENNGSATQPSANLNISITNLDTNEEVFSDDSEYGEMMSDSLAENQAFPNVFTPSNALAAYEGTYTLTPGNGDDNPVDNTVSFEFAVSDTTFAKALSATRVVAPAADNSYSYGNCYYIADATNLYARNVSFAVGNAEELIGSSVSLLLYKWDGDLNEDGQANLDEYGNAPVAFNAYDFDGSESNTLITVPVSIDDEGIALESDSYYFIVTQFDAPDAETNLFLLASEERNYNAMWFASTQGDGPIQYASVLDVGNTGDFSYVGFGWDIVPIMQLHVGGLTATEQILSQANEIAIAPNPTSTQARLDIGLETAQEVQIQLFNMQGKRIYTQKLGKVQQHSLDLDVSDFAAGTYFVVVRAEEGIRTTKLVVSK